MSRPTEEYRIASFEFAKMAVYSTHVTILWRPGLSADQIAQLFVDEAMARGWRPSAIRDKSRRARWIQPNPPLAGVKALIYGAH